MKRSTWGLGVLAVLVHAAGAAAQPLPVDRDGRTLDRLVDGVETDDVERVLLALARSRTHLDVGRDQLSRSGALLYTGAERLRLRVGATLDTTAERESASARYIRIERARSRRIAATWRGRSTPLTLGRVVTARVEKGRLVAADGIDLAEDVETRGLVDILSGGSRPELPFLRTGGDVRAGVGRRAADLVAVVEGVRKGDERNRQRNGTIQVNGRAYPWVSGGHGDGDLPDGEYVVTAHRWRRFDAAFTVGGVGWSFALSDKFDPRVGRTRSLLRIHPDGNGPGTEGCIGITGDAATMRRFREDMRTELGRHDGSLTLRVAVDRATRATEPR